MADDCFYEPTSTGFRSTRNTAGPWDPDSQHVGPPAALLGRVLEDVDGAQGTQIVRLTVEILRPVPITVLHASASVVRPGRRVELLEGTLADDEGEILVARAWRLRTDELDLPEIALAREDVPPGPEEGENKPFFDVEADVGYHTATEWRFVRGGFREAGPATAWTRMRIPLVAGEEPSPLVRVLVMADSGNGISAVLDVHTHLFINTDLTVSLHRLPAGEWLGMKARSYLDPRGVGVAESEIFDERGRLGRGLQSLLVAEQKAR